MQQFNTDIICCDLFVFRNTLKLKIVKHVGNVDSKRTKIKGYLLKLEKSRKITVF